MSGLIADSRRVVNQARGEAANYRFTYSQPIPLKVRKYYVYYIYYIHILLLVEICTMYSTLLADMCTIYSSSTIIGRYVYYI